MVDEDRIDLLIANGRVIDAASSLDGIADIAIRDARIAAIAPSIDPSSAVEVIDANGMLVTPGLIDLHVHAYHGVNAYGVDIDPLCRASSVTTAVDAGSSGPVNFAGFDRFVARGSTTRLLAFVAIAQHGVTRSPGDLVHIDLADPRGAAEIVRGHPDVCVGIKVRLAQDKVATDGRDALELALEAGRLCERPIMVHIGETPLALEEIAAALRPGDIITHCFTPLHPSVTDANGELRPELKAAQQRGVIFDVAHASGHFSWEIARGAMAGGLVPDVLSTDIHGRTNATDRGFLLFDVMSKFLALDMKVSEVIEKTTTAPARAIGWQDRIGALAPGRVADVSLLSLREGRFRFVDSLGRAMEHHQRLEPFATVRSGRLSYCR